MGEIVNLNQARKARNKAEAKVEAAANRASHGRSKEERDAAEKIRLASQRALDGAKRED